MSDMNETQMSEGLIAGYASVFHHVDRGGDLILPGAFLKSLDARRVGGIKLLWQHDPKEPVGVIEEIYEDHKGLYIRGRLLLGVSRAREAHGLLQARALDGLSIGFHTLKSDQRADGVRILQEVDLWEISLVTFPMNELARVASLKSDILPEGELIAPMQYLTTLFNTSFFNNPRVKLP